MVLDKKTIPKERRTAPLLSAERAQLSASLGESHFREFKSGLHGAPDAKTNRPVLDICRDIASTLVAFANADGGDLLVGVEDTGEVSGLNTFSTANIEQLLGAPRTHVHPDTPLGLAGAARASIEGKIILYFSIPKSSTAIHLTSDGKCRQRKDLMSVPVPPQKIQQDRVELRSREYDRDYVDGPSLADLDGDVIQAVADQISKGMSPEKCLQYLGLADFEPAIGLRLRRAALLLFARKSDTYHPRLQVRILKVNGTELGSGVNYNVVNDDIIRGNIIALREQAWEKLRAHLVQTQLGGSARFEVTYIYPELACQEALINSIAHRDYSEEGQGVEIYVFNDRIEIQSGGAFCRP
jgi:ATP-dependent DNA helicase RecG